MFFSQRKGLKPAQKMLQLESVDDELRFSLWSCLSEHLFRQFEGAENYLYGRSTAVTGSNLDALMRHYWFAYFKLPTDSMPAEDMNKAYGILRDYFFKCPWNEIYDFIEFTLQYCPGKFEEPLKHSINSVLERENAGYRLVGLTVAEITNEQELTAIDDALKSPLKGARQHFRSAVTLMSDRKNPDYRNSIKESISAVEAVCRAVTGQPKATLGAALNVLQAKVSLHAAMKTAFSSLYGYTSDEQGIRHAMLDEPNVTFSDAKFMLVACSAFVNFVVGKAAEGGIKLKQ